ncbi:hydroxysteroid 11-beta-dehydrogenase 1-like protein isoform X4 [Phyllostomus discolor]|uniref:Hydroxysteroid 11-beta-dehydrogenase 1-like protein n=1 Tax=Phyllostomus discolor TaxID=89673 RepID=A0A7E6EAM9_9CHIR|nr:hydroxysteroid 11-beta-dehydrogenase 1-like protein isoform X4 [Phyllostomus discolor]
MKRSRVSTVSPGGDPKRSGSPGNPPALARGTHCTGLRRVCLEASCHGNTRADLEGDPRRAMKVLLLTGLGALFFTYYWADNFDPASLQGARVLLTGASAGVGEELAYHYARLGSHLVLTAHTEALLQKVNFLSYVQLTSLALPSLTDSKGSLVVVSSLLGRVPTSFSSPYSAAKFALDSFFGSLRRELDVQDVNVAITMCVLGLQDHASAAEGVRGVTRAKSALGPKAALAVIRGSATRTSCVFYPWRFHVLCLLRTWLPHPKAWFIRQELNVTVTSAV